MPDDLHPGFSWLAPMLLVACCGQVPRPRDAITSHTDLLAQMATVHARLQAIRARGKADHFGPDGRVRGTVYFFVERRGRLRFEALTPMNTPAASLASDGQVFGLLDAREGVYYTGPAEPCNIARLLRIPMATPDVAAVLLGSPPIIEHDRGQVRWDGDGFYELSLSNSREGLRQRLEVGPRRSRLEVLKSELRDRRGVVYTATFSEHERTGGFWIPREIHFENPREDADVLVRYDNVETNPDLPEDAWTLTAPAGLPTRHVTCP